MPRASLHSLLAIGQRCKTLLDDRTGCFSTQPIRRPRLQAGGAALYGEPSVADGNDGWNMMSLVLRVPSDEMFAAALEVTVRFWFALVVFGIVLSGCASGPDLGPQIDGGQARELRDRWSVVARVSTASRVQDDGWASSRDALAERVKWASSVGDLDAIDREFSGFVSRSKASASEEEFSDARVRFENWVRHVRTELASRKRQADADAMFEGASQANPNGW